MEFEFTSSIVDENLSRPQLLSFQPGGFIGSGARVAGCQKLPTEGDHPGLAVSQDLKVICAHVLAFRGVAAEV
ncbi:hypothetical protein AA310_04195 [Arthrobacter sp. YC-RL1]|nr:hypothetical protein ATC04_14710 [Arthrobacter sp. YC-RL1]KLI89852.1 hypothetical protein AA310_04195 [Arthrobacter sp. YC-RL1]